MSEEITFINIIQENFPLILSSFATIVSIITNVALVKIQVRNNLGLKYLDLKQVAYNDLLNAIVDYNLDSSAENEYRLLSACEKASVLSHVTHVEMFQDVCRVLFELIDTPRTNIEKRAVLEKRFKDSLTIVRFIIQQDLTAFDPTPRKRENKMVCKWRKQNRRNKF